MTMQRWVFMALKHFIFKELLFLLQEVSSNMSEHECPVLCVEILKWYEGQIDFRMLVELKVTNSIQRLSLRPCFRYQPLLKTLSDTPFKAFLIACPRGQVPLSNARPSQAPHFFHKETGSPLHIAGVWAKSWMKFLDFLGPACYPVATQLTCFHNFTFRLP